MALTLPTGGREPAHGHTPPQHNDDKVNLKQRPDKASASSGALDLNDHRAYARTAEMNQRGMHISILKDSSNKE